jgi:hypothetical protein
MTSVEDFYTTSVYCHTPLNPNYYRRPVESMPRYCQQRDQSPAPRNTHQISLELLGIQLPEFTKMIEKAKKGLTTKEPELIQEGVGGTYFLKNAKDVPVAVFKPTDEEACAVNNPKSSQSSSSSSSSSSSENSPSMGSQCKKGITVGEASNKECAAYLLDRDHFSGVPATCLVRCTHSAFYSTEEHNNNDRGLLSEEDGDEVKVLRNGKKLKTKVGSLQQYVDHECASWDMGPSRFPVHEVHKIGLLDLRLFNLDRHGGNILVNRQPDGNIALVPIDHGYCLPGTIDCGDLYFEWLHWPQAKVPFTEETKKYIMELEVGDGEELLKACGIKKDSRDTYVIMDMLLKKGIQAGMTLYDLGCFLCREGDFSQISAMEKVYQAAKKCSQRRRSKFLECISRLLDEAIHDYMKAKN